MKTLKSVLEQNGIPARLVRAVVRQTGKENLADIARHGCDAGFSGFTYYSDTVPFFKRNRAEIVELVNRQAEDFGENPADMVAGFQCLAGREIRGKSESEQRKALNEFLPSVCRCLYGGRLTEEDTIVANALAWYAAEEVARAFEDE